MTSQLALRDYQQQAVDSVYRFLRHRDGNPLVVLPVGAGKSLVIAQIVKDAVERWNGRVLMVTHVQELVAQNADKIRRLCPDLNVGVFCSALKRRDAGHSVVCASIQSICKRADDLGPRDLILIDEAHTCPPDGDGMYRKFLERALSLNPLTRVIGLTATPYRLTSGPICRESGLFQEICCDVGLKSLIDQGYLAPLFAKAGAVEVDLVDAPVRGGEFVPEAVEKLMNAPDLVEAACEEIVAQTRDRQACLIFTAGINHGRHMVRVLHDKHGIEAGFVDGETPADERASILARFKGEPTGGLFDGPPLKYVVNYGVLTTGFDCPRLDAIAVLRATQSPGLLVQMLGRGTRLHPGKRDCLVLDFGGNILRHGPIDAIVGVKPKDGPNCEAPARVCPDCRRLLATATRTCPECGHVFPPPELPTHDATASAAGVLSGQVVTTTYDVLETFYHVHVKRRAPPDAPRTMRVDYRVGLNEFRSEWVCFEHAGYARDKAVAWWRKRSPDPVPDSAERAVEIAAGGGLAPTCAIKVRSVAGEPYDRIVDHVLGPIPAPCEGIDEEDSPAASNWFDPEEVPF